MKLDATDFEIEGRLKRIYWWERAFTYTIIFLEVGRWQLSRTWSEK
jgi:hypothetical protein